MRSRVVTAALMTLLLSACSSGGSRTAAPGTGSALSSQQAAALGVGSSLWVSGTIVSRTDSRWCIRDQAATICAAPSAHLRGQQMPAAFRPGLAVRARLTGGTPAPTWTAVVTRVG